jgi:hypothetical protein
VELVANWRAQPPVQMDIGPVLHPDDVMAGKMDALYSVHRIWRAFGLKPWLVDEFTVSPDPFLIDKVRDVVGLFDWLALLARTPCSASHERHLGS